MVWSGDYQRVAASGVDLTLLESSLALPLSERLQQNARMVQLCDAMRAANPRLGRVPTRHPMSPPDFQGVIRTLAEGHVDFVLIGGLAMIFHGSSHVTRDVDICYSRTPENIARLTATLAPLHPYLRGAPRGLPFRFDAATITAGLNFTLDTDLGPLDVLGEVSGVGGYEDAVRSSETADFLGMSIRVLSLDGLIAAKKAAARTKDQSHLLELEELKRLLPE
jgi:predicted nucleotidyltransferase